MTFAQALSLAKEGKCITRLQWDDFQFVYLTKEGNVPNDKIDVMTSLPDSVKEIFRETGNDIRFLPNLAMVYPEGTIIKWTPDDHDLLAEDWIEYKHDNEL